LSNFCEIGIPKWRVTNILCTSKIKEQLEDSTFEVFKCLLTNLFISCLFLASSSSQNPHGPLQKPWAHSHMSSHGGFEISWPFLVRREKWA
jgi:hypothetical protein